MEWELYFVCGVMCPSVAFHWAKHVFVGELINKLICAHPPPSVRWGLLLALHKFYSSNANGGRTLQSPREENFGVASANVYKKLSVEVKMSY